MPIFITRDKINDHTVNEIIESLIGTTGKCELSHRMHRTMRE